MKKFPVRIFNVISGNFMEFFEIYFLGRLREFAKPRKVSDECMRA